MKIYTCQIVRGLCIALIGLLWVVHPSVETKTLLVFSSIAYSLALFAHFLTYWFISAKYYIACLEMNAWYSGEIIARSNSTRYKMIYIGVIGLFFCESFVTGIFLYDYLSNYSSSASGRFGVMSALGSCITYMVPCAVLYKSQNIFVQHCEYQSKYL